MKVSQFQHRENLQSCDSTTVMTSTSSKVHFGDCLIHPIDCIITNAERYACWYTASEYSMIKARAHRMTKSVIDGTPIHQHESIRGLEKLQTCRETLVKRKRNVLQSTIALQSMTVNPSDTRTKEIKSTLERYVRKNHKNAAEAAKSRAQLDYLTAQEIYKEVESEGHTTHQSDKKYYSVQHCHYTVAPRCFTQQSLAAVSA
jgi:hypothetical protein